MKHHIVFIIALGLLPVVIGFGINYIRFREKVEQIKSKKAEEISKQNFKKYFVNKYKHFRLYPEVPFEKLYPDLYLEQPLDHFDTQMQGTYLQRYWVNQDHWNSSAGPVFLYIGGEAGLDSFVVQSGEYYDLAVKYGALIFAVEHRYYGKSLNKHALELNNLQYLSSQQALADLASFHIYVSKKYGLTKKNKWISFGGSYPGALSAWFRIKYPHLVYGAIASSAPVHAEVNFEGYNEVVSKSLADPVVNGSDKCASYIRKAFQEIDDLLLNKQYTKLAKDFKSCDVPIEERDIYQFVSNLADAFMSTVQYNNEELSNIALICDFMTETSSPYKNLMNFFKGFTRELEQNCTDNKWSTFMKLLQNTTPSDGVGFRQWIYQTCTQFGYYQTCDPNTTCLFSEHMTLGMNLEICSEAFNINPQEVFGRVKFTNSYYGGSHPSGTRIVFVNGSIDPWHALSINKNISGSETAIYINGTAHCADMASSDPTDPPALTLARKKIDSKIGMWLTEGQKTDKDTKLYFRPQY